MPDRRVQITLILGRQIGMRIPEDMQRLSLGGAVAVGLILHLRMRNKVPVVGKHPLLVLGEVLQRCVVSIAGAAFQKAVMALDHAQGVVQARMLSDRAATVKR